MNCEAFIASYELLIRLVFPAAAIALAISYRDRFDGGLSWAALPPPQ